MRAVFAEIRYAIGMGLPMAADHCKLSPIPVKPECERRHPNFPHKEA